MTRSHANCRHSIHRQNTQMPPAPSTTTHGITPALPAFWLGWLTFTTVVTVAFGLLMVVAPGLTKQGFGLMIYQNASQFSLFDPQASKLFELAHAVMGSVMAGWGALMFMLVRRLPRSDVKDTLNMLSVSLLVWFVPDTTFSVYSGLWQNAVLNASFAFLYGVGLWGLRGLSGR